jgi:hypothetical protein
MVRFGIPDCPIFPTRGLSILLVADMSVTAVSHVVASVVKTRSRSFLGGSASVVMSLVHTTPPKEDKVGTSSVEAPRPKHWWPDQEVRRRMILLLMMTPTF